MNKEALSMCGTFSKHPSMWGFSDDVYIKNHTSATSLVEGTHYTNYTDWVSGLGAILLGGCRSDFINKITAQTVYGVGHSFVHQLEYKVAEQLVNVLGKHVPSWSPHSISVRFANTGSDVCAMAVRLARAVTDKEDIISCGYHGWNSEFIAAEEPAHGIPEGYKKSIYKVKQGDIDAIKKLFQDNDIAAVITEHPPQNLSDDWYPFLREICDEHDALFIMDEVVTGLRFGLGGASEKYYIKPDLVCMGKALGNGFPVSALVGYKSLLSWFARVDPVFCSSTHWGNTASLVAASIVLDSWSPDYLASIWRTGQRLMDQLRLAGWNIIGHPPRSILKFESNFERAFFIHGMRSHYHLFNRPNFPTLSHSISDAQKAGNAAFAIRQDYLMCDHDKAKEILKGLYPRVLFSDR